MAPNTSFIDGKTFSLLGGAVALSSLSTYLLIKLRSKRKITDSAQGRVNHLSFYASDTEKVAADLAYLVGGEAHQLGPLRNCGGWVCFLNPPLSKNLLDPAVTDFIEIYPRTKTLIIKGDGCAGFDDFDASQEKGAAVHVNLSVPFDLATLEERCRERKLRAAFRGYLPILDVWLEEEKSQHCLLNLLLPSKP
eukprot:CAMPEP_0169235042 /NCGR_PEP_ID=MMETSP1016-20121227/28506_1 /TAXON_ID=342587 /ORGANISM="Karlodinium micrum, Strain CCMP2283" /LENGTH=192 /DNA_ID=CAMNT_0009314561 /DNA_START=39 /DNA_END=617 /DNA_ORIENTATION=+